MKRRVSFTVLPTQQPHTEALEVDYTFASAMSRIEECLESIGETVPSTAYRVTYTLALKHGRLTAFGAIGRLFMRPFLHKIQGFGTFSSGWDCPIICQLPAEWQGKRFNRKVTPL